MSRNDCAPYATARTSILVYKGKGILVKRALSRDVSLSLLNQATSLPSDHTLVSRYRMQLEMLLANLAFKLIRTISVGATTKPAPLR